MPEYFEVSADARKKSQMNVCLQAQNWKSPATVEETGWQTTTSMGKSALWRWLLRKWACIESALFLNDHDDKDCLESNSSEQPVLAFESLNLVVWVDRANDWGRQGGMLPAWIKTKMLQAKTKWHTHATSEKTESNSEDAYLNFLVLKSHIDKLSNFSDICSLKKAHQNIHVHVSIVNVLSIPVPKLCLPWCLHEWSHKISDIY